MILIGYSWVEIGLGTLYVTLIITVLVIAYKKLLMRLQQGVISKDDFCVLYALEEDPVSGEVEFYFTSELEREIRLVILDSNMDEIKVVIEKTATSGGNIVRFDSQSLSNGEYFFCLKTENQKTMKKMRISNH